MDDRPPALAPTNKECATKFREEIKILNKTYSETLREERGAIKKIQNAKLKKLRLAKWAESIKQNRTTSYAKCHGFPSQPLTFSGNILSAKPKGNLERSKVQS